MWNVRGSIPRCPILSRMKEKKVMAFGTFDLLHKGHLYFLGKASNYGKLYVVIARDKTVRKIKGKKPQNNEKTRLGNISKLPFVCKAFLGSLHDRYKIIEKIMPQIICLGYDQKIAVAKLKSELRRRNINSKIIRLKAYKPSIYKTSKLRTRKHIKPQNL